MSMMAKEREDNLKTLAESLQEMEEYLIRIEQGYGQIVTALQSGNISKGIQLLDQMVEGLIYFLKLSEAAENLLGLDLDKISMADQLSASALLKNIEGLCGHMVDAAENKDYSLLGDALEYDLGEQVAQAKALIKLFLLKLNEIRGV